MKQFAGLLIFAVLIMSCGDTATTDSNDGTPSEKVVLMDGPDYFGEKFDANTAIALPDVMNQLSGKDSLNVQLLATVEGVCQAKGCWMNLVSGETAPAEIFVKFKDYGFFMPKDIAGRQVIANGVAYKEVTSVDELRHYAEDGGATKEEIAAITEPKEELKFMASGVKLLAEK